MSVGAVNKDTGDRIPTAGMPAIDSALSGTSTNPVQNAIITAALGDKQDSTDNNLQTTDKTVVGAVNELKSGLTNVDNAAVLNTQDLTTPSRTKNLISANATEMKAMNTDGTWSGDDYTLNGVTFACTFNSDGYLTKVHLSGTASAQTQINLVNSTMGMVSGGSYKLNGLHSTGSSTTFRLTYYNSSMSVQCYGDGSGSADKEFTFNYASGESIVYIRVFNGYEIPSAGIDVEPQIRLATITDSTFAPYIPSVESRLKAVEDVIPDAPSSNGTYTLKATVSSGSVTYSWVADT